MYEKTITVFNRYKSRFGDTWHPTVITNVNLIIDRASIFAKYGENATDNAILNVRYNQFGDVKTVEGKPYLPPKEWESQVNEYLSSTITFAHGEDFDFFIEGDYGSEETINDDDYEDGFYNYMNDKYDNVFAITSVSILNAIPHFEITGK